MSPLTLAPCPHELRPGTTVCLKCRNASRALTREKRRRVLAVVGLLVVGVAAFAVVGAGGADALQSRRHAAGAASDAPAEARLAELPAAATGGVVAVGGAPAAATPAAPPLVPRVPEGRTELRDSMYVVRAGSSATVYFDTPLARTRRRDKFEAIVRATLPAVYGAAADSLLAAVPAGRLVRQGDDLLGALPTRGLRLPAGAGWSVALWPETRAGQQGPLVVAYRATVVR